MSVSCKSAGFTDGEVRQAVRIQIRELNQGFLSSLGEDPLALIFHHAGTSEYGVLVLAVDSRDGSVVGYVLGSTDTARFYQDFLRHHTFAAVRSFLPRLLSWRRMLKAFETLLYPTRRHRQGPSLGTAELLDLAVDDGHQGTGVAQALFAAFVEECRLGAVDQFTIPTAASLERAHRFYERMGATRVTSVEVHDGELSYVYTYRI